MWAEHTGKAGLSLRRRSENHKLEDLLCASTPVPGRFTGMISLDPQCETGTEISPVHIPSRHKSREGIGLSKVTQPFYRRSGF